MILEKTFFYNKLHTTIQLDDDTMQKVSDFFEIKQMSGAESFNLEDMKDKEPIRNEILLLRSYTVETARNGKPFLKIEFNNSRGVVVGRMFDNNNSVELTIPMLDAERVFYVEGSVNTYQGKNSINIDRLSVCREAINPTTLLPATELSVQELLWEMFAYMDALKEPHRTIALKGLQIYWKEFSMKPAAKGQHHAYLHGLLVHSIGLMRIAKYITEEAKNPYEGIYHLTEIAEAQHKEALKKRLQEGSTSRYNYMTWAGSFDHVYEMVANLIEMDEMELDKDLIIACIFYHDLGKIFEYTHVGEISNKYDWLYPTLKATKTPIKGGIDMDPLGKYMGHMATGIMLLKDTVEKQDIQVSLEDIVKYNHCILAHHGKLEWGTNIKPMMPEAVIMHLADFFDSRWEKDDEIN